MRLSSWTNPRRDDKEQYQRLKSVCTLVVPSINLIKPLRLKINKIFSSSIDMLQS
jgi:hypothetical protein